MFRKNAVLMLLSLAAISSVFLAKPASFSSKPHEIKSAYDSSIDLNLDGGYELGSDSHAIVTTPTREVSSGYSFYWNNLNPSTGEVEGNETSSVNLLEGGNFHILNEAGFPESIRHVSLEIKSGTFDASKVFASTSSSSISALTSSSGARAISGSGCLEWFFDGSDSFLAIGMIKGAATGVSCFGALTVECSNEPTKYAPRAGSEADLWDGQRIYFANAGESRVATKHDLGTQINSARAIVDANNGLNLDASNAYGYLLHRVKQGEDTCYSLSFESNGKTYYLCDSQSEGVSQLSSSLSLERACYWNIEISDHCASIENRENASCPMLRYNVSSNCFSCYAPEEGSDPLVYIEEPYEARTVAQAFADRYLHMDSNVENQCLEYYPSAKPVFMAMSSQEKEALFVDEMARLSAWASANGDYLDNETRELRQHFLPSISSLDEELPLLAIALAFAASFAMGLALFCARQRKLR